MTFGIGRRDGDRADRAGRLVVEDRRPGAAVVGRLPDAAVDDADVERVRLAGDAVERLGPAGAVRPDVAPAQLGEHLGSVGDGSLRSTVAAGPVAVAATPASAPTAPQSDDQTVEPHGPECS